jgi:hypothetical protein
MGLKIALSQTSKLIGEPRAREERLKRHAHLQERKHGFGISEHLSPIASYDLLRLARIDIWQLLCTFQGKDRYMLAQDSTGKQPTPN